MSDEEAEPKTPEEEEGEEDEGEEEDEDEGDNEDEENEDEKEEEKPAPVPARTIPQVEADNQGDEDGEPERKLMEEELLQEMVRDRELSLKMIRKKLEQQSEKMERTKNALSEIKKRSKADKAEQQMELETLGQRLQKLIQQYKEAKEALDMKKQQQGGAQLHLYNEVMKSVAAPESRDSSYVMRMQAQLCKAMHSMGMVETQFAMATAQSENIQKYMRDTVTGTVEEKSQVELRLMNDLMMEDASRKDVEVKNKDMMQKFTKERDALLAKIEKQKVAPPEEDDDDEKEELMEILTQGREEIERMEAENKEELAKLEFLKEKVVAIKGPDYVEEMVNAIAEEWKEKERQRREEEEDSEEEDSD